MRRKLQFLLLAFFFSTAAPATEYRITQEQLQKLEKLYQSYKTSNQTLQEQLQRSQSKAETLQKKAENLQKTSQELEQLLKNERTLTQNLNESLTKYEARNYELEADRDQVKQDLLKQKIKNRNWIIATLVLAFFCLLQIAAFIIYARIRK